MNVPQTDISHISKVIGPRSAEAAFPSNLDDGILYQIARDLRLVELSATVDDSIEPPLAGPMYLILHLLQGQAGELKRNAALQMSEERLRHWLQRYMFYIEREVVSRAIKMPCHFDSDDLMSEIKEDNLTPQ